MSASAVYGACAIADLPTPYVPSERMHCADCRTAVWVDPNSLAVALWLEPHVVVCCTHCLVRRVHMERCGS
jgi:hypothetical protein